MRQEEQEEVECVEAAPFEVLDGVDELPPKKTEAQLARKTKRT